MQFRMDFTTSMIFSLIVMFAMSGCGYAKVGPKANEYSLALYSVCNQRDASRLETIAGFVETSLKKEELTPTEASYLNAIIEKARMGEWEQATAEARSLRKDQVE